MKFGEDRIRLSGELLKGLAERVVEKGEGYQRARQAFTMLLGQYANGTYLVTQYIGGVHMNRDHRDDPDGRDPFVPAKADKQRDALKFLQEQVLTDKPFQYTPELLRKLASDRWMHWGSDWWAMSTAEFPLNQRILNIQRIVLNHCFDPSVLARVQNNSVQTKGDDRPLQVSEIFRSVTDGVWSDLAPPADGKKELSSSVIRRNLQREYVKKLAALVLGQRPTGFSIQYFFSGMPTTPPDARSLARMHLREIAGRIDGALKRKDATDDATRAHLEECQERIAKVLTASMQVSE
jgi:Met-zincin